MKDWKKAVDAYCEWLKTGKGKKPDLSRADLSGANLSGADLSGANLRGANLRGADLSEAYLSRANLRWASLRGADLSRADLSGAYLSRADLSGADLSRADLSEAYLRGANLRWANLPAPTVVLSASWGNLPDKITLALMRLDCSACPDGKKRFDAWVKGGPCPYDGAGVQRVASFREKKKLWKYGPPPSIWKCMCMVLDEKCPGWRG